MLILTRQSGESILIDGRTVVTVALVGREFVDLCVEAAGQAKRQIISLTAEELTRIAHGVCGRVLRFDHSSGKVRLGLEIPAGVSVVRTDLRDELAAGQEVRHEASQASDDLLESDPQ